MIFDKFKVDPNFCIWNLFQRKEIKNVELRFLETFCLAENFSKKILKVPEA